MYKETSYKMNKLVKNVVFAALVTSTIGLAGPAFAISSADECKSAVEEVTRELLKANVNNDDLGKIDTALVAADAACGSGDFGGAEAELQKARTMISAAAPK